MVSLTPHVPLLLLIARLLIGSEFESPLKNGGDPFPLLMRKRQTVVLLWVFGFLNLFTPHLILWFCNPWLLKVKGKKSLAASSLFLCLYPLLFLNLSTLA